MIGKYVVVRTYSAGIHLGVLADQNGTEVRLLNSRRLWAWCGAFTLNAVAKNGVDFEKSKLSENIPEIFLTQAIEIIPVAKELVSKFQEVKAHDPS